MNFNFTLFEDDKTKRFIYGFGKYFDRDLNSLFATHEVKQFTLFYLSTAMTNILPTCAGTTSMEDLVEKSIKSESIPIDLPFKKVILESEFGFTIIKSIKPNGQEQPMVLYSIACEEIGPGDYKIDCFCRWEPAPGQVRVENMRLESMAIVKFILRLVFNDRKTKFGEEIVNETIKIKKRHGTEFHKVRKIVHVTLDGQCNRVIGVSGEPIDWQHSWEVRGHWRVCRNLGKNRDGDYCVPGYTWVVSCIKGSGPLIKKVRETKIKGELARANT